MKRNLLRDSPRHGIRRFVLMLLLIAALPRMAPAASYFDLRVTDVKKGESTDDGQNFIEIVDLQWSAKRNETHSLQFSPDLVQPFFVIDSFTLPADGVVTDSYFLPPNTPKGFFRIGLPQVQINSVQPFTIVNSGGIFFLTGQVFDPSYQVRIDGNPVSATFIDSTTFQVNVGPLAPGFHTITIVDASNNVVATLSNGLFVNATGRSDQESPPQAPKVNVAFEIKDFSLAAPAAPIRNRRRTHR